ncbi:hypothetical protein ACH42_15765 [Endozoicomonas sp. (ex Bugula neritina AB1)]|nr:hypothetical protein ACH42_15765 [Endozoicomonas sp. (ex Bugula neritina AB1)]
MKLARLSALTAAMTLISATHANDLINDGTLDLHLRNYYLNSQADNNSNIQWSQAFSVDFSSGFYKNIIGFDLGVHYALKLRGDIPAGDGTPGLLPVDANGKADSYGKTSYAIKVNLADMGMAKYGRMFIDTPLLNNNYSRSLPGLTEAFYAEGSFQGVNMYGIWATKSNDRISSGFMDLMVNGKKEAVKVLGGGYDFGNGIAVNLAAGQQDDVARKYYADLGYAMGLQGVSIESSLQYGQSSARGYSKSNPGNGTDEPQKSWGLSVSAGMHQATFGISYQRLNQSGATYANNWSGQGGMNDTEYFGPNSLMISDFNGDGQKSWGLNAGYDFTGMIDGLSIDLTYVKGGVDSKDNTKDTDENEYNLTAVYALPQIENLSVSAQYAKNTKKDKFSGTKETEKQIRLIVKYDMSVF